LVTGKKVSFLFVVVERSKDLPCRGDLVVVIVVVRGFVFKIKDLDVEGLDVENGLDVDDNQNLDIDKCLDIDKGLDVDEGLDVDKCLDVEENLGVDNDDDGLDVDEGLGVLCLKLFDFLFQFLDEIHVKY
jgi:hypothetical protein